MVINLITEMKPHWTGDEPYPGDVPYNHNEFRQHYSDHHPIVFQMVGGSGDDD